MAHRTPGPLRALGVLLRALTGLALLIALVGGVPFALLVVGHQPTELSGGFDLLMRPDDGTVFLVVLTLIGWAGWAAFTFSVLVEIVAVLRRRSAPHIRGLGGLQSLASFLIGGILLLAPTAASAATSTPAVAVTATQTVADATPSASASTGTDEAAWPQHTVTSPTESPWDLAEEYLGNGQRWKDIAALNPGIPELAAGDAYLPQGAVINLPADARTASPATEAATETHAAATATPKDQSSDQEHAGADGTEKTSATKDTTDRPHTVTVHTGDSLWKIADTYGDPTDWPAIYKENKGETQPGGGIFDDPDLIFPGQKLDLPQEKTKASDRTEAPADNGTDASAPPADQTPDENPDTATPDNSEGQDDGQQPASPKASTPAPSASRTPEASPVPSRTPEAAATPAPSQSPARQDTGQGHVAEEDRALAPAAVWMGAGVLAAALMGTLATRRVLQQRRRRPGRRIPMPKGSAAATEQSLRAAQHPTGFDLLNTALRTLALNLAANRELPVLEAVVLHDARVDLHLANDTPACAPFTAAAGRHDMWTCAASNPDLAAPENLQAAEAPYPALVSLGWDPQGHLVLVDLEHVGILNLAGDEDLARHVLQAIAVELATTSLPGHLEVTALGNTTPGLDTAAPERVARTEDLAGATAELAAHSADQRRTLAALGADSLRAARLRDDAGGAWTPHIILAQTLPDAAAHHDAVTALFDTLADRPRTASAVITAAPASVPLPADAWTLTCHGPGDAVVLPGSGLPVHLQGLSDNHFADAIELLALADSDTDIPAPDWTRAQDDPDDDGLPAEYADIEEELDTETAEWTQTGTPAPTMPEENGETPGAGMSLADVLAEDDDTDASRTNGTAPTTAGPADVALVLGPQPCVTPAKALHVTITDQATQTKAPRPEPATATPAAAPGPVVLLLGSVGVEGATGRVDSNRKRTGTELAAYLALHPGVDHHAIDEALWPGQIVNKTMRNAVISRLRSWLGTDPDGNAHFPRVQDVTDHRYRFGPHVTCDWTQFQQHARKGLNDPTEDGDLALRQALALVRGRPFAAIDPQRYAWAEPAIQEMASAIVDVAYDLSTRCRDAGDIPGALWAASQGLLAAEENELLHRALFLAHHAAGDVPALRAAAAKLARINEHLGGGVDMEAETAELLRNLLPRTVTAR